VLGKIGIKPTDAVNMLMHYIAMYGELPFKPRIPNAETLEAMREANTGGDTRYKDVDAMFKFDVPPSSKKT
jgi:DNA-damage-inducible protein J